jgi:hypothetical protein
MSLMLLVGCGSVSDLQPTKPGTSADLRRYQKVVVHSFTNTIEVTQKDPAEAARARAQLEAATRKFNTQVTEEIRLSGAFAEVIRGETAVPDSIVIDGVITRAVEGSKAARLWVGFGAGNAYFDATLQVRDGSTGELLATLVVDRNSWGGGGLLAAEQTMDSFMLEAAKKVASDLAVAKMQGRIQPATRPK